MKDYQDIILPIDMSTLSVKAKHGSDPPLNMSASMRRKVAAPMYTAEMTRAKTVNTIEEQQLTKKLKDLEKQQSKMQSEILNLKAALLPEIKVTSAWEDSAPDGTPVPRSSSGAANGQPDPASSFGELELPRIRKRSGSLPPLDVRKEAENSRQRAASESVTAGARFAPAPPTSKPGIRRARSMNEIDQNGRQRIRPKSAHCASNAASSRRRSISIARSQSLNSSTESLPSDLPKTALSQNSSSPAGSTDNVSRARAQTITSLLPLRKAKSTSNMTKDIRSRRVTVDTADLTRLDKDSIFRNPSYNPVLFNPCKSRATNGVRQRRATSPVRLSHLSPDGVAPSPPEKSTPSLQDQFEQLKACRYLRVPSEDSD